MLLGILDTDRSMEELRAQVEDLDAQILVARRSKASAKGRAMIKKLRAQRKEILEKIKKIQKIISGKGAAKKDRSKEKDEESANKAIKSAEKGEEGTKAIKDTAKHLEQVGKGEYKHVTRRLKRAAKARKRQERAKK